MLNKFILIVLLCSIILNSCSNITYECYDKFDDVNKNPLLFDINTLCDVTNVDMTAIFQSDFGWDKLVDQKLLYDSKQIVFEVEFSSDVPVWQIKSARDYAIIYLFNGRYDNLSPTPYENWRLSYKPKSIYVSVLIDGEILIQDYFDGVNEEHFENTQLNIDSRKIEFEQGHPLIVEIEELVGRDIVAIESIVRDAIIIQINGVKQISPETLDRIRTIAEDFSDNYTRIVLELYQNNNLYYDTFYINQEWKSGKWS